MRLDDDGIAGDEGRPDLAGEQGGREIPGGDPGDDADRRALNPDLLGGPFAREDLALQPPCAVGGVAEQKGAELNVDARPADELSTLGGQGLRQRLDVLLDERCQLAQISRARHGRQRAPSRLALARRRDGAVGVVDAALEATSSTLVSSLGFRIPRRSRLTASTQRPPMKIWPRPMPKLRRMYRHCRLTSQFWAIKSQARTISHDFPSRLSRRRSAAPCA